MRFHFWLSFDNNELIDPEILAPPQIDLRCTILESFSKHDNDIVDFNTFYVFALEGYSGLEF